MSKKTPNVEVITTQQAEQRWGQCKRTDGYHPYCACTYKDRPEVHYYATPREDFSVEEAIMQAEAHNKTIVVVEDLS